MSFSEALFREIPKLCGNDVSVYAFDPTPKSKKYVEAHALSRNPRFHFYSCGLSDYDGMETFYFPKDKKLVSGSVIPNDLTNLNDSAEVPVKTLSSIMAELGHSRLDILKMDIEGSEFKVIPQILDSGIDITQICLEFHDRFYPDGKKRIRDTVRLLNDRGYYVAHTLESGWEILFVRKA